MKKYSQVARENQWLLCSGEDIVWVVGKRLDDRFKIVSKPLKSLEVSCHSLTTYPLSPNS